VKLIRILASARADLEDGYRFYEKQAAEIGRYFLDSLYSDVESLQVSAGVHVRQFGRYYCLHSKRFPFAVYYRIVNDEIRIYAILDCRRRPERIRERLKQID